jgi:hypothetical protein
MPLLLPEPLLLLLPLLDPLEPPPLDPLLVLDPPLELLVPLPLLDPVASPFDPDPASPSGGSSS